MFEIFVLLQILNFVVANVIIFKNLKSLKISDNKRLKNVNIRQAKI